MALDEFNKFGHPGNLKSVTKVNGGETLHCTGSMYGVGAVVKFGSYDGFISLSDGGVVSGSEINAGVVYPFSVSKVSGGSAGSIYVFKTQKVS